ncbi:MAG: NifB/NifX family molybdenum-iron cluster-binding protein [Arcobacteraceae bacterium]|jgi:predicted Fe-Mo cluster-binding NifX family protein|nr:NifB/NifX family molybdenum-iron cluster-binding protein [Arcobacteraceae bacterium]
MLAIPISNRTSTTISDLFGNTPFFILLDEEEGCFTVITNEEKGNGLAIAGFLAKHRVTKTIFYHMGEGVYNSCLENNIEVYKCSSKFNTIDEIFSKLSQNEFQKLDSTNYKDLLDSGTTSCKCGCEK